MAWRLAAAALAALSAVPLSSALADDPLARPVDVPGPEDRLPTPMVHRVVVGGLAADPAVPEPAQQALLASDRGRTPFPMVSPLQAWTAVTDRFGVPRGEGRRHSGIDLALATYPASPVYAACEGTVVRATWDSGYGMYVEAACGDGWSVLTAHLSRIFVSPGQQVALGQPVGISGSTGFSTGEHLHFEVRKDGIALNPELFVDFGVPPEEPIWNGTIHEAPPGPEAAPADVAPPNVAPVPSGTLEPVEDVPTPAPATTPTPVPVQTPQPTATATISPTPSATPTTTGTPATPGGITATPTAGTTADAATPGVTPAADN